MVLTWLSNSSQFSSKHSLWGTKCRPCHGQTITTAAVSFMQRQHSHFDICHINLTKLFRGLKMHLQAHS